jgi:hypothetical protein
LISTTSSSSGSQATALAQGLHRAGLFKHIPALIQAVAVQLGTIQDDSTLLLAASNNVFTKPTAELEAAKIDDHQCAAAACVEADNAVSLSAASAGSTLVGWA